MKCTCCPAETRVLETRTKAEHFILRRHVCENGHRFNTVQLLESVISWQRKRIEQAQQSAVRGTAARRAAWAKDQEIARRLQDGQKASVIKGDLRVSGSRIKRMRDAAKPLP